MRFRVIDCSCKLNSLNRKKYNWEWSFDAWALCERWISQDLGTPSAQWSNTSEWNLTNDRSNVTTECAKDHLDYHPVRLHKPLLVMLIVVVGVISVVDNFQGKKRFCKSESWFSHCSPQISCLRVGNCTGKNWQNSIHDCCCSPFPLLLMVLAAAETRKRRSSLASNKEMLCWSSHWSSILCNHTFEFQVVVLLLLVPFRRWLLQCFLHNVINDDGRETDLVHLLFELPRPPGSVLQILFLLPITRYKANVRFVCTVVAKVVKFAQNEMTHGRTLSRQVNGSEKLAGNT